MKKWLAALCACLVSGVAYGQTVGVQGQTINHMLPQPVYVGGFALADTSSRTIVIDPTTNGVLMQDAARDRDLQYQSLGFAQGFTSMYPSEAVQSQAVNTLGWRTVGISIYPTYDDSTGEVLWGITPYRAQAASTDSTILKAWIPLKQNISTAGAAPTVLQPDTLTYGNTATFVPNYAYTDSTVDINSGEMLILTRHFTNSYGTAGRGFTFDFIRNGVSFTAPFTSVRIRVIRVYSGSGVAYVEGKCPHTTWTADLVGSR